MTKTVFDLEATEAGDAYKLLSGLVVPRPIGWIGTRRSDGTHNLAPFSFFNLVSTAPPIVLFSAGAHRDRPKDTASLAEASGEFTVNIVSEQLVENMSVTSGSFSAEDDEFVIAGLTPEPGRFVAAPLVAESPANLECRVVRIVELGEVGAPRLVIGDVLAVHVDQSILDGTRIDHDVLRAVGRIAGNTYVRTRPRFEVNRPS
ncbi:MAG TPA: flavin reductase family protein [Acidimicrobiia bacterium]|nr:flavin reductase family protein [Acidimicrobiia bacterium]